MVRMEDTRLLRDVRRIDGGRRLHGGEEQRVDGVSC